MTDFLVLTIFPTLVIAAAIGDLLTLRIPNWLNGATALSVLPMAVLAGMPLEVVYGREEVDPALARLADHPQWHCWFVGGTQRPHEQRYLDELKRAAAAAGIAERVRFVGARSDVADILRGADVFCHPNRGPEPFGVKHTIQATLASRTMKLMRCAFWREPCASWQLRQFSRTGACSQSTGPRISAWQLRQLSATEVPVRSGPFVRIASIASSTPRPTSTRRSWSTTTTRH